MNYRLFCSVNFQNTIQQFICKHQLLQPNERVLVGVSGGKDSICLIHLLHTLGYKCTVAHMNFTLRGSDADADESFVVEWCKEREISCYHKKVDTRTFASANGLSIEMAARELRYNYFYEILEKEAIDKIAVGHHKNDQAETLINNLVRGTGLRGLAAMKPISGKVIRPLLCVTREDIDAYIQTYKLWFRTDVTNADSEITRNHYRHIVLPELEKINPSIIETLSQTSLRMNEVQQWLDTEIEKFSEENTRQTENELRIDRKAVLNHPHQKLCLFELLHPYGINNAQLTELTEALSKPGGQIWTTPEYNLTLANDAILIQPKQRESEYPPVLIYSETSTIEVPLRLNFETMVSYQLSDLSFNNQTAYFDYKKLQFPLTLRKWEAGDRFIPFGMKGSKKVSDLFTDLKINRFEKEKAFVLLSGNEIIWVVGYRTSEKFKLTTDSTPAFKIMLKPFPSRHK